jgi:hypothetical protein
MVLGLLELKFVLSQLEPNLQREFEFRFALTAKPNGVFARWFAELSCGCDVPGDQSSLTSWLIGRPWAN